MIALPKSRKLQALLLTMTIVIVIGYAWLAARTLEPRFELPRDVIKASIWVDATSVSTLQEIHHIHWRELDRASSEVTRAAAALRWLAGRDRALEPLDLVIRSSVTERLNVTGSRIEIGSDLLIARGQLAKAILKSFLLQRGSIDLISSHLRLDVASDVLLAMTDGGLDLEVPGRNAALHFEPVGPWWSYAKTYRGVCDSNWKSLELMPLCRAKDSGQAIVSNLSFRPLIGAIIWDVFSAQPVAHRYAFAQKWSHFLSKARAVDAKAGTRAMIRAEVETLLPVKEFPEAAEALARVLASAKILEPTSIEADLLVRKVSLFDQDREAIETLLRKRPKLAILARTKDGLVTLPGGVAVDSKDLAVKKVKNEVVMSCVAPPLREIAKREAPTARLVWVRQCGDDETPLVYGPLLAVGMEGFARSNPGLTFTQYRPAGVAFALRTGRIGEPWFGLAKASWVDSASAYKVNGAIEAVEWHRSAKAPEDATIQ